MPRVSWHESGRKAMAIAGTGAVVLTCSRAAGAGAVRPAESNRSPPGCPHYSARNSLTHLRGRIMAIAIFSLTALALAFGGLGAWTWVLGRRAERSFPPLGQLVAVQDIRLHYVEQGPAGDPSATVPIVLVHGAFGALQDFTATILDDLARSHRVIAFDRPGHGHSERPAPPWVGTPAAQAALIHEALVALGVNRPLVVGFSWGGTVALSYALQFPGETGALVLLASPSYPWPDPIERKYFIPTWPLLGPLLVHTIVAPVGQLLSMRGVAHAFYPLPVSPAFARSPYPLATRPGSFAANAEDMRLLKDAVRDMSARYGELTLPMALIHGDRDRTVRLKTHSAPFHANVPASELAVVPGAGHQLLYTHPHLVLEVIERLAKRVRPALGAASERRAATAPR